jgi:hypothetical protein
MLRRIRRHRLPGRDYLSATMSSGKFCASCGAPLSPTAKFCHRCGAPTDGSGSARTGAKEPGAPATQVLPWAVAAIALLCLLAFIVGQNWSRGATAPPADNAGSPARAVDISQMSPQERADRLFQRVMTYVSDGKTDSVQFFVPMAIQSVLALAPLDAHRRYDLGLLAMVAGDPVMASAQADTILAAHPTHLLGLTLGMRIAGMRSDTAARRQYADRLLAAIDRERATRLPEYADHAPDIDAAAREAAGGPTLPLAPPTRPR